MAFNSNDFRLELSKIYKQQSNTLNELEMLLHKLTA